MPGPMTPNQQGMEQSSQPTAQRKQPQQSGPSMPLVQGPPVPAGPPQMQPFQPLPQPGSAVTSRPLMPGLGKQGGGGAYGNPSLGGGDDELMRLLTLLGGG